MRSRSGFTILEVLIAGSLLALGLLAFTQGTKLISGSQANEAAIADAEALGTDLLNLINQGTRWLHGDGILLYHFLLNYLVPYSVASYSAVRTRLQDIDAANSCCKPNE